MDAYHIDRFGSVDGIVRRSSRGAPPGPRDVLMGVRASSLNYRELMVLKGGGRGPRKLGIVPLSDGAGGRRGCRGFGGPSRNCSPYQRTRAITGLRRMPTPRSSTKAHSAAMWRTTSSAVKLVRRDGVSVGHGEFCHPPGALSNVSTKYRCHHLCHLQMSLAPRLGSGVGRARSPRRSAAPDRRPLYGYSKPYRLFYRAGASTPGS